MAKKNVKKQAMSLLSLLATIVVVAGGYLLSDNKSSNVADYSYYVNQSKASEGTPSQELASSVLTEDVKKQLGNSIEWNGAGAFIINGNQTDLDASVASVPYGDNKTKTVQGETVPTVANALLAKSTRQYKDREEMARIQEKIHVMKAAKDEERVRAIAKNVPLSDMDYVDVTQYKVDQYDDK